MSLFDRISVGSSNISLAVMILFPRVFLMRSSPTKSCERHLFADNRKKLEKGSCQREALFPE